MISLGAHSGYEIRQAGEISVRFFWALGPPKIYSDLGKLEEDGLIEGRDETRGGRARRDYRLTPAGESALSNWVAGGEGAPMELRDPELLRLFFADAVTPEQAREQIARIRERSRRAVERFEREIEPAAARAREDGSAFPAHIAEFGHELHEFIVDWCARLEQRLD
jgi:DNA-binding PadR family transcriptional regulator